MTARRVLVAGGAGFIGSHLCRRLVRDGAHVICVDSFISGRAENIRDLEGSPGFRTLRHDIANPLSPEGAVDAIFNLACPASPVDYRRYPIETLKTCSLGALNLLALASELRATLVQASTSEVYGDPDVSPQPEGYWGNVNPLGLRSPYDEGKRFAEAACMAFHRLGRTKVRIARIFNTYGPGMRRDDGRVVPTFIGQALAGEPLTVYGDGSQTRSLCFVDDMVDGLVALERSPTPGPYNLGNPDERTVLELAKVILELTGSKSAIVHRPLPQDDPLRRCPDIRLAQKDLGWSPRTSLADGLRKTIEKMLKDASADS